MQNVEKAVVPELKSFAGTPHFVVATGGVALTLLVFTISFSLLQSLYPNRITSLPEIDALFRSVDVRAQSYAAIISLGFFSIYILAIFHYGAVVFARAIQAVGTGLLGKIAAMPSHQRFVPMTIVTAVVACTPSLLNVVMELTKKDVFGLRSVPQLMMADPHIYSVMGIAGETFLGTLHADDSVTNAYGLGFPITYATLRWLGLPATYQTAFDIARFSNVAFVLTMAWCLIWFWRSEKLSGWHPLVFVISVVAVVAPLLLVNGSNVVYANLSGFRYLPVALFFLIASLKESPAGPGTFAACTILAAAGVALFPDTGLLAVAGYAVFIAFDEGSSPRIFVRGVAFLAAVVAVYAGLCLLSQALFSVNPYSIWKSVGEAGGEGFGGIPLGWQPGMLVIVSVSVYCGCAIICNSFGSILPHRDKIVLAASFMVLCWIVYYMHRVHDYFIFWFLALFPLSFLMQNESRVIKAHVLPLSSGALVLLSLALMWSANIIPQLDTPRSRAPENAQLTSWSGLMIPEGLAVNLQSRLDALKRLDAREAVVVTGMPYAVTASGAVTKPPVGALFYLGQRRLVVKFINKLLHEHPAKIVLEATDSPVAGSAAIAAIVERIEMKISDSYTRDETISEWRVWRLKQPSPH